MINGAHVLLNSTNADADRTFLRDVLGLRSVDAGHGWLIFKLPPAEVAVHPAEGYSVHQNAGESLLGGVLYLMCDDVQSMIQSLKKKNVHCTPIHQERWGLRTTIPLPSGGAIGLYQPTHPTAFNL